eukprot:5186308-Lingulodinium_polyedra.AAC.1
MKCWAQAIGHAEDNDGRQRLRPWLPPGLQRQVEPLVAGWLCPSHHALQHEHEEDLQLSARGVKRVERTGPQSHGSRRA